MNFEQEVEQIARQYRSEGYAVITHPDKDHLPGFAVGFDVDLLATRGDERVLVQIKSDRAKLQEDPRIPRLAEIANKEPGWRYDVIVLNEGDPFQRLTRGAREPSNEEIEQSLRHVESLLQAGDARAALVFAWATLEAAMRHVASSAELSMPRTTPAELIRMLYGIGVLTRTEFELLRDSLRVRTEIVHGLVSSEVNPDLVPGVVGVTRRLLSGKVEARSIAV
jgi:hypothetical protein